MAYGADHYRFAGVCAFRGHGTHQIGAGLFWRDGVFKKHPQKGRIGVDQRPLRVGIGCGDDACGFGLVGQKTVDEIIDRLQGFRAAGCRFQSVKV